jgi:SpoVK/Ycf46/Vps4 family AAA+-type ATPase
MGSCHASVHLHAAGAAPCQVSVCPSSCGRTRSLAGRFDRRVAVERPDRKGREEILRVHIRRRSLPLGADVTVESVAAATMGFTGADLANLVNEAALLAGRRSAGRAARQTGRSRSCPGCG